MTRAQSQHRFAVITRLRAGVFLLGIDLSRHRHRGRAHSSRPDVRHTLPDRGRIHAGVLRTARDERLVTSRAQLAQMAVVGVLLLVGGNLTLAYAEKHVASGLAALIIAVTPLWFLVLDSLLLGDHHIALRGKIGLGLGVAGLLVLLWPDLSSTTALGRVQFWARSACWADHSAGRWVRCWPRNGSLPKSIPSPPPPGR